MKRVCLLFICCLGCLVWGLAVSAASFPENGDWIGKIRKDHPRMIFSAENLPALRERANTVCRREFAALKKKVDALPDVPVHEWSPTDTIQLPDGKIKPKQAATRAYKMVRTDGAFQANQAALVYLVTGDEKYARKAQTYLLHSLKVLQISEQYGQWADWQGNFRINQLLAYDWICNTLTPEEKKAILQPILEYLKKSRSCGSFKFRRSPSSPSNGNYGEDGMLLFAGLAGYGDGIDDPAAEEMLRFGVKLYVDMLDYRENLSAGSGLLTSLAVTYSFGPYPLATFFFFHLWKSAFGEEVSGRWMQMCDYPNWFDYAAIDINARGHFLYHGFGDVMHQQNRHGADMIYTHMAQVIHFYGKNYPEKVQSAWWTLQRLPHRIHKYIALYPFMPFALTGFDPADIQKVKAAPAAGKRYFYNPGVGLLLMRSGVGKMDTYAGFRFGGDRDEHQHYDELSFVIYKNGFLAMDGGTRCNALHHNMYAAQTVAHNSILIHQEKEPIAPFWQAWGVKPVTEPVYSHGGQFRHQGGKALALQSTEDLIYAAGDGTGYYNPEKSKEVTRQFIYIKPDIFVIFDRVESVRPEQKKELIFHAQNEPQKLAADEWRFENGGVLYFKTLLPEKADMQFEGGPGKEFLASGRNWMPEGGEKWDRVYQLTGKWVVKVADPDPAKLRNEYLHVLRAGADKTVKNIAAVCEKRGDKVCVRLTDDNNIRWILTFNRTGTQGLHVQKMNPDGTVLLDKAMPNQVE